MAIHRSGVAIVKGELGLKDCFFLRSIAIMRCTTGTETRELGLSICCKIDGYYEM